VTPSTPIAALTREQSQLLSRLASVVERRLSEAGQTDRDRCTLALHAALELAELPPPRRVIWARSPVEALRDRAGGGPGGRPVLEPLRRRVKACVWAHVVPGLREWVAGRLAPRGSRYWLLRAPELDRSPDWRPPELDPRDFDWLSAGLFWRACGLALPDVGPLVTLADGCDGCWRQADDWILVDRPVALAVDRAGRLHHASGPALTYRDRHSIHAWHGVRVPGRVIEDPASLTLQEIVAEDNQEVRAVMVERYGLERIMAAADVADPDPDRTLYRLALPGGDPVVAVRVRCPSTGREYLLRVPPHIATGRAAVAWTFSVPESDYRPRVET
jgi:hypothetical protein